MKARSKEEWDLIPFSRLGHRRKRERLLERANYACTQCGFDKRRVDGLCILEIDHIDGTHTNNSEENLRVLCPNCHAMTPTYKNFKGTSKEKTSTRFRKENRGYAEAMKLRKEQEKAYESMFIAMVTETHQSKEIDYSRFGWVQRLTDKLGETIPHNVRKRLTRLMPDFFVNECFIRSSKKRIKT